MRRRTTIPDLAVARAILPIVAMIGIDIGIFMGVTLVSACAVVLGSLLADLVTPFIDSRIRIR